MTRERKQRMVLGIGLTLVALALAWRASTPDDHRSRIETKVQELETRIEAIKNRN